MQMYRVPQTDLIVSRIGYGAASLVGWDREAVCPADVNRATRLVHAACDQGITLFDHADVYAFGKSEEVFGKVLKATPGLREKFVLQSKCGQVLADEWNPGHPIWVNLSCKHIVASANASLQRLATDHLDILLLHAPSTLVKPEEVAEAFDLLHRDGKVRFFGVSNYNALQIHLLKRAVRQPIAVNQIRLGLGHADPLADGIEFSLELAQGTLKNERYTSVTGSGTLDYCRANNIQIQAYSPLRGDLFKASDNGAQQLGPIAKKLRDLATIKNCTPHALALAWLLHHPACIVPITGATDPEHIIENCAADRVSLTGEEWYELFASAVDLKSRAVSELS